ncbi:hypothetical protein HDU98_006009, partial [Podochytrium sp. JEL0797]
MQLTSLITLISAIGALASPVALNKRQSCSFGAYQCSGQAVQQCAYGAGSVLSWTTVQTCTSGTYCTTGSYVGCLT